MGYRPTTEHVFWLIKWWIFFFPTEIWLHSSFGLHTRTWPPHGQFQVNSYYRSLGTFWWGLPLARLPTACSCFLEPAHTHLARVRRSGGNYLGNEQHANLDQGHKLTGIYMKSDPELKHTFPDSHKDENTEMVTKGKNQNKNEGVIQSKSKQDNFIKRRQSKEKQEMGGKNLFQNLSFLNSTLTNFGYPLHNIDRKG